MTAYLAQTVDDDNVQAIKKNTADLQSDAQAIVDQIKDRGDAFVDEAETVRDGVMENMQRVASTDLPTGPVGPIDFDEIVQGAATNAAASGGEAPQLIAFESGRASCRERVGQYV